MDSMDVALCIGSLLEIGWTESGVYAIKLGDEVFGSIGSEIACDSGLPSG